MLRSRVWRRLVAPRIARRAVTARDCTIPADRSPAAETPTPDEMPMRLRHERVDYSPDRQPPPLEAPEDFVISPFCEIYVPRQTGAIGYLSRCA